MVMSVTQRERGRKRQLPVVRLLEAGCVAACVGGSDADHPEVWPTPTVPLYGLGRKRLAHNTGHSSSANPKAAPASRPRTASSPNRSTVGSASSTPAAAGKAIKQSSTPQ